MVVGQYVTEFWTVLVRHPQMPAVVTLLGDDVMFYKEASASEA